VNFPNSQGLRQLGENLYAISAASGDEILGDPGEDGLGFLQSGYVETSNVDPTIELIDLIRTQRAYEMNSQTIRAADETLRAIAQIRR
jgi:flagellar basal-body rod protein FlgG